MVIILSQSLEGTCEATYDFSRAGHRLANLSDFNNVPSRIPCCLATSAAKVGQRKTNNMRTTNDKTQSRQRPLHHTAAKQINEQHETVIN
eukprot:2820677-Amphidinium_carterae.2